MTTDKIDDGFGTPDYGDGNKKTFAKKAYLKTPKPGEETIEEFRFIPPIKLQRETGAFTLYHRVHSAYKSKSPKDPNKSIPRDFFCIQDENRKTGEVYVSCPECEEVERVKEEIKDIKLKAEKEGKSEAEIKELTRARTIWVEGNFFGENKVWGHQASGKWYSFVMNPAGEFFILSISHKCKLQLDSAIKKARELGIDPLDPSRGVFFSFKRTGSRGNEVTDTVDLAKTSQMVDGELVQKIKFAPLSDAQKKEAVRIFPDLSEIYTSLSREQIQRIVKSKGDPDAVEAAFNVSRPRNEETKAKPSVGASAAFRDESTVKAETPKVEVPKVEPVKTTVTAPQTAPVETASPLGMSDDDFIAQFGAKTA